MVQNPESEIRHRHGLLPDHNARKSACLSLRTKSGGQPCHGQENDSRVSVVSKPLATSALSSPGAASIGGRTALMTQHGYNAGQAGARVVVDALAPDARKREPVGLD
jgi:hypothetical protein